MSADRCSVCGEKFWFETDGPCGIGIVRAVHPPTPCVPRPPVVYEPDDVRNDDDKPKKRGGQSSVLLDRICHQCHGWFSTFSRNRKTCSDPCAKEYRRNKMRVDWRRSYQRRKERAA